MNIRKMLLIALLFLKTYSFGQVQGGAGINIGSKNTGIELQGYSLNRAKIFVGFNINRFDSFSNKIGCGIGVFKQEKKHNFWVNSSAERKYSKTTILEKNGILYRYYTNNLNYWNFGITYSLRIPDDIETNNFFLIEIEIFNKLLLNQLNIEPLFDNAQVSTEFETDISKYFRSGIGCSLGIKYLW